MKPAVSASMSSSSDARPSTNSCKASVRAEKARPMTSALIRRRLPSSLKSQCIATASIRNMTKCTILSNPGMPGESGMLEPGSNTATSMSAVTSIEGTGNRIFMAHFCPEPVASSRGPAPFFLTHTSSAEAHDVRRRSSLYLSCVSSSAISSACFSTVSVASICISGG